MTIGLGIVTCGRPEYFLAAIGSVHQYLDDVVDEIHVYNDMGGNGVAVGKNTLLSMLMAAGHEWIFLMEDDIVIDSPRAVTGYIEAAEDAGEHHLMFAHHGPRNLVVPNQVGSTLKRGLKMDFYPNAVGAWCLYTDLAIERVGLMDEGFPKNCLEHVEHSMRIAAAGMCSGHPHWPDVHESREWLHEIPGSFDHPAVPGASASFTEAKAYWKANHPDTYLWSD